MSHEAQQLTLGDLLAQDDLALELLTGGDGARARRVAGAHSIEIERPTSWLGPGWIMLTTGVRLRGNVSAQRALVAELDAAGAAALGFGLDLVFKRVPAAVLEEARGRGFPVFGVPLHTPFREIVTRINRALLSSDLRTFQRLSSMQLYLLDALRDEQPRAAIASRVSTLLHASVLVLSPGGDVELAVGDAPAERLWGVVGPRPVALHEVDVDGWHAVAAPVLGARDEALAWLVVAADGGSFPNPLTKPVAQAAAPLLAATARLGEAERAQARAIRSALLDELLRPQRHGDVHALELRAASLGIDFAQPVRVLLAQGPGVGPGCERLDRSLAGLPHLVSRRGSAAVELVQGGAADVRARVGGLVDDRPGATAGLGREVRAAADLPHSLRDAHLALQRVALDGDRRMLSFEDFELGLLLISEAPVDRLRPKLEEWTAPLRAHPMLWEAIVAYFEQDMDVTRTAEALHLHPNSLRYRLSRVEKLLGRSLKQPSTIAGLYIALLASPDEEAAL